MFQYLPESAIDTTDRNTRLKVTILCDTEMHR